MDRAKIYGMMVDMKNDGFSADEIINGIADFFDFPDTDEINDELESIYNSIE